MGKKLLILLLSFLVTSLCWGQTLLNEGFESGNVPPSGWMASAVCASCPPESWFGWTASGTSHTGNYSAFVDYAYPSHSSYLITPQLPLTGHKILTFWIADDYPYAVDMTVLTVEISTSGTNLADFTVLQTITLPSSAYQFVPVFVDLQAYSGQDVYIAFHIEDEYGTGVFFDDIFVGDIPDCQTPTNLTASNVSHHSVDLSWNSPSSAASFTVQCVESQGGWENAVSYTATDTAFLLSGLNSNTSYDIRVRAVCDSAQTSEWTDSITVHTLCEVFTVTALDMWMESFENVVGSGHVTLSNCWETPLMSPLYHTPALYCGLAVAAHTGTNSLELKGSSGEENLVVLPAFTNSLSTLRMSFFANTTAATTATAGTVQIGYVTDVTDASTFTSVETLVPKPESLSRTSSAPYGPFYFLTAPDSGRIAIRFTSNSFSTSWNLDDIVVSLIPDCPEAMQLHASNISSSSADLSWNISGDFSYDILIWPSGTTDTAYHNNVPGSSLPFTVNGLLPETAYTWLVRTNCNDSTHSVSTERGHFTTPEVSIDLPYLQTFEGELEDITEFIFSGTGNNQWYIGPATGVQDPNNPDAHHSMYISDDQGFSNHYSGSNSYAYALFAVQFPSEQVEYHLEFDYKLVGEGGWDYFSVYLIDGGDALPSSGAPSGTPLLTNMYNTGGWVHANLILPNVVGASKEIVFYWVNDSYVYGNPPVAVDNIAITTNVCARPTVLTVQDLQSHQATLHWQENASATSWNVYYRPYNTGAETTLLVVHDSTFVTLTNLNASTDYLCYVTAICDTNQESNPSNPVIFKTLCGDGIEFLPYNEDFSYPEALSSDAFDAYVPCWSRLFSDNAHRPYVNTQDFGDNCLDFHYTPGCYTMAVLPPLSADIPANSVMLSFDARRHDLSSGALEVGVMTDPNDASTFQVVDTITFSATHVWESHSVYCNNYTGNGQYLAFRVYNAGNYTVAIDNLTVDSLPSCMPVEDLSISHIMGTSASLAWQGNADSYTVFVAGPSHSTYTTTYPYILLSNLLPSTSYTVLVSANCGGESSALSSSLTFTTPCGAITVTEDNSWVETFESYGSSYDVMTISSCWATPITDNSSYYTYPGVVSYSGAAHSGNNSVELYGESNMLVLPEFTNPINTLRISFWCNTDAQFAEYAGTMELGYITDVTNPGTFTAIQTITPTALGQVGNDAPYTDHVGPIDLLDVTAPLGARIALRYTNNLSSYNSWNFDDFSVSLIPSCPSPSKNSVTFDNITSDEAQVSWVDNDTNHTAWVVYYRANQENTWQTLTAFQTTATLTNLTQNTTYEVYVVTLCDSVGVGTDATFTRQFTTEMLPTSIPFSTDFTESEGWHFNNGNYENYWMIGPTTPTGNTHALFVTNNGVAPGYNVNSPARISAEKLFLVGTNPEILVSFDVNVGGDFGQYIDYDYDFMKLIFAPSTEQYEQDSESNPTWSSGDDSTYAYNFTSYLSQSQGSTQPYTFSMTSGNTVHINAILQNPNPNPTANSTAKLVFVWVNDYTDGTQPGAVISNLSVSSVSCQQPTNLTAQNVGTATADITWDGSDQSTWVLQYKSYYGSTWTTVTVPSNSFHLTGLTSNSYYEVRVAAVCNDGETSIWSELMFKTHICEAEDQCTYSLYLTDDYGDGWNGATLTILQNDISLGTFTVSNGYTFQTDLHLCDSTPTTFSWFSGVWDGECTIYLYGPDGTQIYTQAGMTGMSGVFHSFVTDCGPEIVECEIPMGLLVTDITDTTAYIDWMIYGTEESYVLEYTTDTTDTWVSVTLPFNQYDFTNLTPNTTYYVRVKANCGGDNESGWSDVEVFTTTGEPTPVIEPVVLTQIAMDITDHSATLNGAIVELGNQTILERGFEWKKTSDTVYTILVLQSIDPILAASIDGLTPSTNYTFRAFATTANTTTYGQLRYFTTLDEVIPDPCDIPIGLDTLAVDDESITVGWTYNPNAAKWNVRYRLPNTQWNTDTTATNSYTFTGLTVNTTYEIQVQAVCLDGQASDWCTSLLVTTYHVGIDNWLANGVTLYPNPAREYVDICTAGDVLVTSMEVYDVYGKVVRTVAGNNYSSPQTRIDIAGLADGMYFVRVMTDRGMVTKPFVKR